jgi:hypothetical protein
MVKQLTRAENAIRAPHLWARVRVADPDSVSSRRVLLNRALFIQLRITDPQHAFGEFFQATQALGRRYP